MKGDRISDGPAFFKERRIRAYATIFAICLWTIYFWNISAPGLRDRSGNIKGTDFLHFYTLGTLALEHRGADLYDMAAQSTLIVHLVPQSAGMFYLPLYPPQVSLLFLPFAYLPYAWALALWLGCSAALYFLCCVMILRHCPQMRRHTETILPLALAYPAFWHLILWGQSSALALVCFTFAWLALRARRNFLAGLALGGLIFKPQLGLAAAFILLLDLNWKAIAGAIVSAAVQISTAGFYYGFTVIPDWVRALSRIPREMRLFEPRPYQTHCLRTFWAMLIPWSGLSLTLYLLSAVCILAVFVAVWRSNLPLSLRYPGFLFVTVLIAPHLTVYDLVVLVPAFLLLAERMISKSIAVPSRFVWLLALAFAAPLLGPFTLWTHFQVSVPVMVLLVFEIWKLRGKALSVTATT